MEIGPGIEAADWQGLQLSTPDAPDWGHAISILEQRLRGRFTDVVEALKALMQELTAYLDELRNPSQADLRDKFRTKMNFIAEGKFQP